MMLECVSAWHCVKKRDHGMVGRLVDAMQALCFRNGTVVDEKS